MDVGYSVGSPGQHAVGGSSVIVSTEHAVAKQLHKQSSANQQHTNPSKLAAMSQFLINRAVANNADKTCSSEDFSERQHWITEGSDKRGDEEGSERREDQEESESMDDPVPNAGLEDSHEESREEDCIGDTSQEISEFSSSAKGEVSLKSECNVCGSPAAAHLHYGAVSCYSCRAFFRRGKPRQMRCIFGNNECKITKYNRTNCKFCRYTKCIEGGMIPEKVDATLKKKQERLAAAAALDTATAAIGGNNRESDSNGDSNRESAGHGGGSSVQGNSNRKSDVRGDINRVSAVHSDSNKGTAARDREDIKNKTGTESNLSAKNASSQGNKELLDYSLKIKDMEPKSSSSMDYSNEMANLSDERIMPSRIRCKDMNALNNRDIKMEDASNNYEKAHNFSNAINALTGIKIPANNNVLNTRIQEQIKKERQAKTAPEFNKYASEPMDVDSNEVTDTKDVIKMALQQSSLSPAMLRPDLYSPTGRTAGSPYIGPDNTKTLWTHNRLLGGSSQAAGNSPKNRQLTELDLHKDRLDPTPVDHASSFNNSRNHFMPPGGVREREVPSMLPSKEALEDVRDQHLPPRDGREHNIAPRDRREQSQGAPIDERELSQLTRNVREDSLSSRNVRDHSVDMRDHMIQPLESRRSQLQQGYDLSSTNSQSDKTQVGRGYPLSFNTPTNLTQVRAGQNFFPVIQRPVQNPLNFSQKFNQLPEERFPRPHVNNQISSLPSQSSSSSKYQDERGLYPGPSGMLPNTWIHNYNSAGNQKNGDLFPGPIAAHSSNTFIRNTLEVSQSNHTSVIQRGSGYKDINQGSQDAAPKTISRLAPTNIKQESAFTRSHDLSAEVNRPRDLVSINNRLGEEQSPERIFPHHWSNFMPGRSMFHPHLDPAPFSIRPPLSTYGGQEDKHCNMALLGQYGNPQMNARMQNYLSHNNMHPQMRIPGQHFDLHQQLMDDARARNIEHRTRERLDKDIPETSDELVGISYDPASSSAFNLTSNANQHFNRQSVSHQDASGFPFSGTQQLIPDLQTGVPGFGLDGSLLSSQQQSMQIRRNESFEEIISSSNHDVDFESLTSNIGSQVVPDYLPDLSDLETLLSESITDPSDMSVISNSLRPDPMLDFEIDSMFGGESKKRPFDDVIEGSNLLVADQTPPPKRPFLDSVVGSSMPLKKRRRMYQLEYPIEHGINKRSLPLLAFTCEEELQLINYIDRIEEYQNKRVEFLLRNYKSYRELLISYVNCTKLDSKVPFSKRNESTICILGLEFTKANAAKMFNELGNLCTDVRRRLLHSTYPALYVIFFSILEGNTKSSTWIEQQEKTLYITKKTHSLIMHDYKGLTNVRSISIKDQERFTSPWAQSRADEDKFDYTISLVGRLVGQDKRLQALFHMLVMLTPDVTDTPIRIQDDATLLRMQVIITRLLYRYLCYRHTSGMDAVKEEKHDPQEKSNESSVMKLTADLPSLNPADKTRMFIHLIEEVHDCAKIMRKRSLPGQI